VFAVALGIAAGTILRRTLPALAVTLGVFVFLRLVIGQDLRSHYLTAVTVIYRFGHAWRHPTGSYWLIAQGLIGPGGHALNTPASFSGAAVNGVPIAEIPATCRALAFQPNLKLTSCLASRGYHGFISYQPASRYWAFQGIETGIFVLLAAALIAVTAIVVLRRDA